ncbi:mannonate dehydratase [Halomicrobium urmianum]|uniref:mannonate dehydratase n=1 Tax=Halomicrobium urmianum TaxID=1586233 RepID=UPI001CD9A125|nr:mannonate dehydratase [Halomicrobium urmianum]
MDTALMLPPHPDKRWTMARQLGLSTGVVRFWGEEEWWTYDSLLQARNRFADHGLSLEVVEDRPPMTDTVLGREGRDEEIETVKQLLRNMGTVGIDTYSWVWTENPVGVVRTSDEVPLRGDTRTTAYDHEQSERGPEYPVDVTEAELWDNLEYFLDEVVPVAEEAGVNLALHPDDPPVDSVRGVPRLVNSVENVQRILDLYDSPNHGLTFCQGNFSAMGADVPAAIRQFGDRIHFVHFRDVEGSSEEFVETWHDEGQTDMLAAMDVYREVGFDGPIRPDHVPRMLDEGHRDDAQAGYTDMGRLFAVGYMRGLMEQVGPE